MFHGLASRPPRSVRRAFTLAELLIVIAIIGVLISILLPTLGAARRSANSVKCLSSLRQLGNAFQMYAQDNKRAFPVTEFSPPATQLSATDPPTRTWIDFLSKYLHRREATDQQNPQLVNYEQFRGGSPVWGCPSFNSELFYDQNINNTATSPNALPIKTKYNTGYGMSRYAVAPYVGSFAPGDPQILVLNAPVRANGTAAAPGNFAQICPARTPSIYGSFFKMETWGKRGAERGLVADANYYDILASTVWKNTSTPKTEPWLNQAASPPGDTYIYVDAGRHIKPTASQRDANGTRCVNVLFVDGHATSCMPKEAWIAIGGGGIDCTQ